MSDGLVVLSNTAQRRLPLECCLAYGGSGKCRAASYSSCHSLAKKYSQEPTPTFLMVDTHHIDPVGVLEEAAHTRKGPPPGISHEQDLQEAMHMASILEATACYFKSNFSTLRPTATTAV
eukprot:4205366-Amphidinium_carterae.1